MKNLKNIIKEALLDEVPFGVKNKTLSAEEKKQFAPYTESPIKTKTDGESTVPSVTKSSQNKSKQNNDEYLKSLTKKMTDFQKTSDSDKIKEPKVPTGGDERLEITGYDTGISGMERTADLTQEKGGSKETKELYKKRNTSDDQVSKKLMKTAKETNDLNYDKQANNTRPVKQQTSPQPMKETFKYQGVEDKNIFKANGKLISEEQVIKLANKVPNRLKIDESVFVITDGESYYRMLWESDEPVITHIKNTQNVNEELEKMKSLWSYDTKKTLDKKNVSGNQDDMFRKMFEQLKRNKE